MIAGTMSVSIPETPEEPAVARDRAPVATGLHAVERAPTSRARTRPVPVTRWRAA